MKIKHLEIKDFRNISRASINFHDLNILTGRNSSGKSNFLLALATALESKKDYSEIYSNNTVNLSAGKKTTTIKTTINEIGSRTCYINNSDELFCIKPDEFRFEKVIDKRSLAKSLALYFSGGKLDERVEGLLSKINNEKNFISDVFEKNFLQTNDELVYQEEFSDNISQDNTIKVVNIQKNNFKNQDKYLSFFRDISDQVLASIGLSKPNTGINSVSIHEYITEKGDEEIYKQVLQRKKSQHTENANSNLRKSKFIFLVADIEMNQKVNDKFQSDLNLYTKGIIKKLYTNKKGALSISCKNSPEDIWTISSGTAALIFLITLINWLNLPNTLRSYKAPNILIFDEVDAIIHPTILKDFTDLLKHLSKKMQIFITTHSPYFLDAFSRDQLFFLKDSASMADNKGDGAVNRCNIHDYASIFNKLSEEQRKDFEGKKNSELLIDGSVDGLFPMIENYD
jgi:predicted ATPase